METAWWSRLTAGTWLYRVQVQAPVLVRAHKHTLKGRERERREREKERVCCQKNLVKTAAMTHCNHFNLWTLFCVSLIYCKETMKLQRGFILASKHHMSPKDFPEFSPWKYASSWTSVIQKVSLASTLGQGCVRLHGFTALLEFLLNISSSLVSASCNTSPGWIPPWPPTLHVQPCCHHSNSCHRNCLPGAGCIFALS